MYKSYIGRTGKAPIKQHLTRTVVVKYNAFFHGKTPNCVSFSHTRLFSPLRNVAEILPIWRKTLSNQSIIFKTND